MHKARAPTNQIGAGHTFDKALVDGTQVIALSTLAGMTDAGNETLCGYHGQGDGSRILTPARTSADAAERAAKRSSRRARAFHMSCVAGLGVTESRVRVLQTAWRGAASMQRGSFAGGVKANKAHGVDEHHLWARGLLLTLRRFLASDEAERTSAAPATIDGRVTQPESEAAHPS